MPFNPLEPLKVTDIVTGETLIAGTATAVTRCEIDGVEFAYRVAFFGLLISIDSAGGTVIVRAWNDAARTQCIGTATIDFTGIIHEPVSFWPYGIEAPSGVWFDAIGDATSAGKELDVSASVLPL